MIEENRFYELMDLHNVLHFIEFKAKKARLSKTELEKADIAIKKLEELKFSVAE
ncbi:MAG: hypothetical protein WCW44_01940 [archaeon]